jgi:hypothetical protein
MEPFPVIRDDVIFMPDFAFDLVGAVEKRVYLEIVGYWRPEYISKKMEKLKLLLKHNIPLVLLIDEKLRRKFFQQGYPSFVFRSGPSRFPILAIEEWLKGVEKSEYERIRERWPSILKAAEEHFSGKQFIGPSELEELGFLKHEFLDGARKGLLMKGYDGLQSGLIKKDILKKLEEENLEGSVGPVSERLEKLGLPLSIVTSLGYKISWKSLLNGRVEKLA